MYNITSSVRESYIYPGEYIPLLNEEELKEKITLSAQKAMRKALVKVVDVGDTYVIELTMAGLKREDFQVYAEGNILTVKAMHKETIGWLEGQQVLSEQCTCLDQEIILPKNVDVDFVSAEYLEGILQLQVRKSEQPAKNIHTNVVVY